LDLVTSRTWLRLQKERGSVSVIGSSGRRLLKTLQPYAGAAAGCDLFIAINAECSGFPESIRQLGPTARIRIKEAVFDAVGLVNAGLTDARLRELVRDAIAGTVIEDEKPEP
jgi:hypothetical protein